MKEEWRDIDETKGLYQVSNLGNVRSVDRLIEVRTRFGIICKSIHGKILKKFIGKDGYYGVHLSIGGLHYTRKVHRLVACAFLPLITNKNVVNHKNGNKIDNRVENLEWCTVQENATHAKEVLHVRRRGGVSIRQYSLDGKFLREFNTIHEASRITGISVTSIHQCCNGESKCAKGYMWRYSKDNIEKLEPYKCRSKETTEKLKKIVTKANKLTKSNSISLKEAMKLVWKENK